MSPRAGIYCRMSKSKDLKVEQQEAACRNLAKVHGFDVVEVYTADDGISAFTGKNRPGWAQMLEDVAAGKLDVLLAQAEDRFARRPMDKDTLALACVANGVKWLTVNDGALDPATATGKFFSLLRAGLGRMESEVKAKRQKDANDYRAAKGMVRAGGPRPLGWAEDKLALEPVEAKELRWAVDQVLAGASVFSIVRVWNAEGFVSSKGFPWQQVTVKQVLTRARMAGLVLHRGEVLPEVTGQWEPICTPDELREVCMVLNSKKQPQNNREPKWLLSGIAKCECGLPLRYARNGSNRESYRCFAKNIAIKTEVPHVTIDQRQVDGRVTEAVVSALLFSSGEDLADPDAARLGALHERLQEVAAARARVADFGTDGTFTRSEVAVRMAKLMAEAAELEKAIKDIAARNARVAMLHEAQAGLWSGTTVSLTQAAEVRAGLSKRFQELNLEQRRALVRHYVDVVVHGGRGPGRVEITHLIETSLNDDEVDAV